MGISTITAQLLINRGIYTIEQGTVFLNCALDRLHSPLLLTDIKKAVARVLQAVQDGEKILIYGDYDADGITATVLLLQVTRRLGAIADYIIPNRLEHGYGLHQVILQKAREMGTSLVITVDCGISANLEVTWAEKNGLDIIVTDHHEPPPVLPRALAVLNPKRPDSNYPFQDLAGVGVALKFAQALMEAAGARKQAWQDYLDLVCLGTIADIVPLHGENRILVKHGLKRLANTTRPGLKALFKVSGVSTDSLGAEEVGFRLTPRLNAAGRIGNHDLAVKLLLTENDYEAEDLASALQQNNQHRQELEVSALEEAMQILAGQPALATGKVILLHSTGWHPGVIGIVASRLLDRFYRPVILIAVDGALGSGSARSIPGFNIYQALSHCQEHLLSAGGHALAAGFTIATDKLDDFYQAISKYADHVLDEDKMTPGLDIDSVIDMRQISEELVNEINLLQPFGHSNPAPLFSCRKASVLTYRGVGRNSAHLKMRLRSGGVTLDSIGFNLGAYTEALATSEAVDLAFVPGVNEYNGHRSLQLEIKDLGLPAMLELDGQNSSTDVSPAQPFTSSLPDNYYELFIPDFILTTLQKAEAGEILGKLKYNGIKEKRISELLDRRNAINRHIMLGELVGNAEPALVITACGYQTIETACFLQESSPYMQGKVAFCHRLLSKKTVAEKVTEFMAGKLPVLVTTPAIARCAGIRASRVIIYHLPFNPSSFNNLFELVDTGGRVYLFFSREDLINNVDGLKILAPDRDRLAFVYTMLRNQANMRRQFISDLNRMAREVSAAGYPGAHELTIAVALKVFAELGLLTTAKKGKEYSVSFLPAPREKQRLSGSQTYRWLHKIKDESTAWMNKILTESVENLNRSLLA
ncbi:MAG: single-stranded-DNA-specific exonuclease RecJ [Desulfotomaculaceae bacterium]|nr:single-stranded-DNA-specific exonuclease RecJ [Desulfotomaculaceae bacterium]